MGLPFQQVCYIFITKHHSEGFKIIIIIITITSNTTVTIIVTTTIIFIRVIFRILPRGKNINWKKFKI
jgi:hypothetical protein